MKNKQNEAEKLKRNEKEPKKLLQGTVKITREGGGECYQSIGL
jgi:hypothetical protein